MGAVEVLTVQGLSLPSYAAVRAALAEGFPEAEVLKVEGIEPHQWTRADLAWKVRLVDDPAAFAAYQAELGEAEDWLDRDVSPLGSDVASWAGFLSALATSGEVLGSNGLHLGDVARLRRRWTRKAEQDPKLEERITEARKSPAALPAIRVAKAVLRPSRHARGRVEPAGPAAGSTSILNEPALPLDQYAALCAEIAERPGDSAAVLTRAGLSGEAALATLDGIWRARMDGDAQIAADFRRLFAHNRARLSAPGRSTSPREPEPLAPVFHAAPPAIRAALRGTSLVLDIPRGPALPFAKPSGEAPAEPKPAPSLQIRRPDQPLTGTSLALDLPRGEALPFAPEGAGVPVTPQKTKLAGTSLAVEVPHGPALPFAPPSSAEAASAAAPGPLAAEASSPRLGTGTALALDVPRAPALPFAGEGPASGAGRPKLAGTSLVVDADRGPALPFREGEAPPEVASATLPQIAVKRPPARLGTTAPLPDAPAEKPALPFPAGSASGAAVPPRNKLAKLALSLDVQRAMVAAQPAAAAAAPPAPATTAPGQQPKLTVEQYASLCVELRMAPADETKTLLRYRLTSEERAALDDHYGRRMASEPALRAAWENAYRTYHAWMTRVHR